MIPLETQRKVLTWMSFYPANEKTNIYQKIAYFILFITVFIVTLTFLWGSINYFFVFISIDLKESLYTLYLVAAMAGVFYAIIIGFTTKTKMEMVFDELTNIYNASKKLFQI